MKQYDMVIIGGGLAGLAAAISAKKEGIDKVIILEKDDELGGMLNQSIHNGYGLKIFKEDLTSPEYVQRFVDKLEEMSIEHKLNTTVLDIDRNKCITAVNGEDGVFEIKAKAIILATGCKERPKAPINLLDNKCAGIYTAGLVQRFINVEGCMPGREAVISGSGNIALFVARRMTLEGAKVKVVVETKNQADGLLENVKQCLDSFQIPLKLSHAITHINGKDRVESVTIAALDKTGKPIHGTEELIDCDTLILSAGLVSENELVKKLGIKLSSNIGGPKVDDNFQTEVEGIFACGNMVYIHDFADDISIEGFTVGKNTAQYLKGLIYS